MSAILVIEKKLHKYPHVRYERCKRRITVHPTSEDGFEVAFEEGEEFTVFCGGWHHHFDKEEEALNCFAFALSDNARLKYLQNRLIRNDG